MSEKLVSTDWIFDGRKRLSRLSMILLMSSVTFAYGQETTAESSAVAQDTDTDEVYMLSPFTVESSKDVGYMATQTLSGTRLRTSMRDIGSSISVATEELLKDLNATDNSTLMQYMLGAEMGGERSYSMPDYGGGTTVSDSFRSASSSTRVRGLANADNTLDYFLTDVNWDGYAVERIDMQRGPNAILFGLGSPAGIINATLRSAQFGENAGTVEFQTRSYNSPRASIRYNLVVLPDELAVMGGYLNDKRNYRQKPAYEDVERAYGAVRYAPRFLQSEMSNFTIEVKGERGKSNSNRPRWVTPGDCITQFWDPIEKGGLGGLSMDPVATQDSTGRLGHGQLNETVQYNPETGELDWKNYPNPYYIPSLTTIAPGPVAIFSDPNSSTQNQTIIDPTVNTYWGINSEGVRDGSIDYPSGGFMWLRNYNSFATSAKLPYYETGSYKNRTLTDSSIYDYYNKLLDGDNKHEFSDFHYINGSLRHTFAHNQFGYEISAYRESYNNGQEGTLGDQSLQIDFNRTLPDGSPNPNLGRAYVMNDYRWLNNRNKSVRDAYRASVFAEYDFRKHGDSWFWNSLGKHLFNGVYSKERHRTASISFARYGFEDSFAAWQLPEFANTGRPYSYDDWNLNLQAIHYLSGSLLDQSSAAGSHISPLTSMQVPQSGIYRTFNDTWNAPNVDPAAAWVTPKGIDSTQSENPANYIGWTTMNLPIVDIWKSGRWTNYLNNATKTKSEVESRALVWQGKFFNESLVAMYGWRRDISKSVTVVAPARTDAKGNSIGFKNYYATTFVYPDDWTGTTGDSQTYSLALHVDELKGMGWLPFKMSLYYNKSENFQASSARIDITNKPISNPRGSTKDLSLFLATKDDRFSFRVGKFTSSVTNVNADILPGVWAVGNFYERGTEAANKFYYNLKNGGKTLASQATEEEQQYDLENPSWSRDWNMAVVGGQTQEEENAICNAWYDFLKATPQGIYDAFGLTGIKEAYSGNPQDVTITQKANLAFTQDVVSKGYEFEFSALPLQNWRITLNASKTDAVRSNIGGKALSDWVALVDNAIAGKAGQLYRWGSSTMKDDWAYFRDQYSLAKLLDGQKQPDIRQWTFNIINNYDFREGLLKGVNVGCAYRWADKSAIGYPYMENETGETVHDLKHPYYGPSEKFFDGWVGYGRQIGDKYFWRIKLNVQNIFASRDLIPLNTQPDGTVGAWRIAPPRTFELSTSIDF